MHEMSDEAQKAVTIDMILEKVHSYQADADLEKIKKAYSFAEQAHRGQVRISGDAYIMHPLNVAYILTGLHLDDETICAALLHDVVEDTHATLEEMEAEFGRNIMALIDGVTKLGRIEYMSKEDVKLENYRKMFLAMAKDIRVIMIKLADRLHNMRTLKYMREDKRRRIAKETIEVYAPLANRLGISSIKVELEDLCLRYLEPEAYYALVEEVKHKRQERQEFILDSIQKIHEKLEAADIKAENVNISLTNIKGQNETSAVGIGDINGNYVKNVNITLKDVLKDVKVGTLDLKSAAVIDGKIKVKESTSINIDAGNTKGIVDLGNTGPVSADSVTVDLSKTIGANKFASIVADTVVYKGSTQTPLSTDVNITMKQDINSKDFVANITTSAQADKLVVTAATKFSLVNGSERVDGNDLKTATISGDMGTDATDEYTFDDTNAEKLTKIDFSGLKNVEKGTITNTASKVIEDIKATDGDDTITLAGDQKAAKISIDAGEGENTIKTGTFLTPGHADADPKGQNITIKSGSGNDTFDVSTSVIGAGFDSANESHTRLVTIDKINVGDKIKFAGGTTAIEKVTLNANGNAQDNFALAAKLGGFFDGPNNQAGKIYAYSYLNDTYLVYNAAGGDTDFGAGDTIVKLSGVNIANLETFIMVK